SERDGRQNQRRADEEPKPEHPKSLTGGARVALYEEIPRSIPAILEKNATTLGTCRNLIFDRARKCRPGKAHGCPHARAVPCAAYRAAQSVGGRCHGPVWPRRTG